MSSEALRLILVGMLAGFGIGYALGHVVSARRFVRALRDIRAIFEGDGLRLELVRPPQNAFELLQEAARRQASTRN